MSKDGIRSDLAAGTVNYGQLFEIQPSQSHLVKVTLSGARLRDALEHAIDRGGRPTAHVAGVTVRYDPRASNRRVRSIELSGGRKLRSDATYTLAVDDLLAAGGEGYTMLVGLTAERADARCEGLISTCDVSRTPV